MRKGTENSVRTFGNYKDYAYFCKQNKIIHIMYNP